MTSKQTNQIIAFVIALIAITILVLFLVEKYYVKGDEQKRENVKEMLMFSYAFFGLIVLLLGGKESHTLLLLI